MVGSNVREPYYRCVSLESRSRIAWHVDVLGGGRPLPAQEHQTLAARVRTVGVQNLFESAARWEIDHDPDVLR